MLDKLMDNDLTGIGQKGLTLYQYPDIVDT